MVDDEDDLKQTETEEEPDEEIEEEPDEEIEEEPEEETEEEPEEAATGAAVVRGTNHGFHLNQKIIKLLYPVLRYISRTNHEKAEIILCFLADKNFHDFLCGFSEISS